MFDSQESPRVFAMPPGADFPAELVRGLVARSDTQRPEVFARIELFVNTRRMARRIRRIFDSGAARILPRVRLVTELPELVLADALPIAASALRRRLEVAQLIQRLLEMQPDLAPQSARFDLAEGLVKLFDEMAGEGVDPAAIRNIDVGEHSEHWARSQKFIDIVRPFLTGTDVISAEERQRRAVDIISAGWANQPPEHPIIVAGTTGSRGSTQKLMQAVAALPQGALVLPGFDFDTPDYGWASLTDAQTAEDHPQFRFATLLGSLSMEPSKVMKWSEHDPPSPARNRLVSLALRPAPVTDEWLTVGPKLTELDAATQAVTLVQAPSPRAEARAIALRLRQAFEKGEVAALITPDRVLSRRVEAALDRWHVKPDDSAGQPLPLSPPGRFLRHVADFVAHQPAAALLLTLLKHPLCNTGGDDRGQHLLWTRELEIWLRRSGPPFLEACDLEAWAEGREVDDGRRDWAQWVAESISFTRADGARALTECVEEHIGLAERLSAGSAGPAGAVWNEASGRAALDAMEGLRREARFGGSATAGEYSRLVTNVLSQAEVRDPDPVHANIMIWGTLEARVQGAELVILAGLNEGVWPARAEPDPWLNRAMRFDAGLLLPERRIGLAAHDFQQAIAAKEVWLTRSVRDDDEETVPSRWINRLTNLLNGLPDQGGVDALSRMTRRGNEWLAIAEDLEMPKPGHRIAPAFRPSPAPPVNTRPRQLSVTQIKTLIRDPYAIYARKVLRLRKLDPLRKNPDAPLKGTVIHRILEQFLRAGIPENRAAATARLLAIAEEVLERDAPWPAARHLWFAKVARIADFFLDGEARRSAIAEPLALEVSGQLAIEDPRFLLTTKADRIDRSENGSLFIYDYKTGALPSEKQQRMFEPQLLLEALIATEGGFEGISPSTVRGACYIGLGADPKFEDAPVDEIEGDALRARLIALISHHLDEESGFTSRRAALKERFACDYDQLARFGEWSVADTPVKERLT